MKHILITVILLASVNLFGQIRDFSDIPKEILEQLDKIGVDDLALLNCYEAAYFNSIFKDSLNKFDFSGKRVGFIYSGTKSNKQKYFNLEKERLTHNSTPNNGILYHFNSTQKEESGGYDAAIVYWRKFYMPIEEVIKKLNNNK